MLVRTRGSQLEIYSFTGLRFIQQSKQKFRDFFKFVIMFIDWYTYICTFKFVSLWNIIRVP